MCLLAPPGLASLTSYFPALARRMIWPADDPLTLWRGLSTSWPRRECDALILAVDLCLPYRLRDYANKMGCSLSAHSLMTVPGEGDAGRPRLMPLETMGVDMDKLADLIDDLFRIGV